jgi:hypothetical protein
MGSNPINLGFRFLLEMTALFIYGYWGWHASPGPLRYLLALGLPLIAAAIWGTFRVPEDSSHSGKAPIPIPGALRLFLELGFFSLAVFLLINTGKEGLGWIFAGAVFIHYLLSYDRIFWLLRQK